MSKPNNGKFVAKTNTKPIRKKSGLKRKICRFKRAIRQNRFYHFVLSVFICLVISFSSRAYQSYIDKNALSDALIAQEKEIVLEYENKIAQMSEEHKDNLQAIRDLYETPAVSDTMREFGEYIAKLLYSYRNNEVRDLRTAIWCVFNRVDNPAYPDSIKGVCEQPSQWMGYSSDNPVLADLYDLAMEELETYYNGYRPVSADYIYMSWSSKEIVLRDTWEITKDTRYWQAG